MLEHFKNYAMQFESIPCRKLEGCAPHATVSAIMQTIDTVMHSIENVCWTMQSKLNATLYKVMYFYEQQ